MKSLLKLVIAVAICLTTLQSAFAQVEITISPNSVQEVGAIGGTLNFTVTPWYGGYVTASLNDWWWYGFPVSGGNCNPSIIPGTGNPGSFPISVTVPPNYSADSVTSWFVVDETDGPDQLHKHIRVNQPGNYFSTYIAGNREIAGVGKGGSFSIGYYTQATAILELGYGLSSADTILNNDNTYHTITINYEANPNTAERVLYFKFKEVYTGVYKTYKLKQAAAPSKIKFTANKETLYNQSVVSIDGTTSDVAVDITKINNGDYSIEVLAPFVTATKTTGGFTFTATANSDIARVGVIRITGANDGDIIDFNVVQHGNTPIVFNIDSSAYEFTAEGGDKVWALSDYNTEPATIHVTSNASWLVADPNNMQGNVVVNAEVNRTTSVRTAILTITPLEGNAVHKTITQQAGELGISLVDSTINVYASIYNAPNYVSKGGGTYWQYNEYNAPIYSIAGYANTSWTAESNASWVKVNKASGNADWTDLLTVEANPTTAARTATITFTPASGTVRTLTVNQTAGVVTMVPNQTTLNVPSSAGMAINDILLADATAFYEWSIAELFVSSSDTSWLTGSPNQYDFATKQYKTAIIYKANATTSPRTATVTFLSADGGLPVTITVTQAAVNPNQPDFQVMGMMDYFLVGTPQSPVSIQGNPVTITILPDMGVTMTATATQTWLTPVLTPGQYGDYVLMFNVSGNSLYGIRYGEIVLTSSTGKTSTINVYQQSVSTTPTISVDSTSKNIAYTGATATIKVTSNFNEYYVAKIVSWASIDFANAISSEITNADTAYGTFKTTKTITFTIAENTSNTARTTKLLVNYTTNDTVANELVINITQAGAPVLVALGGVVSYSVPAGTFDAIPAVNRVFSVKQKDGSDLPAWLTFNTTTLTFEGTAPLTAVSLDIVITCSSNAKSGPITYEFKLEISDVPTNIETTSTSNKLVVYPSPAKNTVTIENGQAINAITILDVTGKAIMQYTNLNTIKLSVDLTGVASGVYFIRTSSNNETHTAKIIKE